MSFSRVAYGTQRIASWGICRFRRTVSTLSINPNIYIHDHPTTPHTYILSYLPTSPPNTRLAIGSATSNPPTPDTLTANPNFLSILQHVVASFATCDPVVQGQAKALASSGGSSLGSGSAMFPSQQQRQQQHDLYRRRQRKAVDGDSGAGGASSQGGMGGGGVGGWVHVSDQRNPPDWGRIAWPEDILGSVQVDSNGDFVGDKGEYQASGTYRILTREGILGLSDYLRERLVEHLQDLEKAN